MKTKEELKSTFIRYSPEITEDIFKRIIDKVEQLGFTQHSTCNNYDYFVSNCLVLHGDGVWYIVNEYGMNKRPEIEVSDILGDGWWDVDAGVEKWSVLPEAEAFSKSLLEHEETKTMKDKYVEYNKDFTEDMFNHMLDWVKKQNCPRPPYRFCANTFDNFKTKGYFWFGSTRDYSYGVDNNSQNFDEITFEELFPEYKQSSGCIFLEPELDYVTVELIDVPDI